MIRTLNVVWLIGCAALGLWVASMYLDDQPPYVYSAEESRMVPEVAKPESQVVADWKLEKINRICPGSSHRRFRIKTTGAVITPDPTPLATSTRLGDKSLGRALWLPPGLRGEIGYSANVCFGCNVLQRALPTLFCVTTPELTFHVTP